MDEKDDAWFADWERELTTVRSVLAWTESQRDAERGLQLASALFLFWWARDHLPGPRVARAGLPPGPGSPQDPSGGARCPECYRPPPGR